MIEKKPRTVKPPKDWATEMVLSMIPFLNMGEEESPTSLKKALINVVAPIGDEDNIDLRKDLLNANELESGKLVREMVVLQSLLRNMIAVGYGHSIDVLVLKKLQEEINLAFRNVRLLSNWVPGETWISPAFPLPDNLYRFVSGFAKPNLLYAVSDAFKSGVLKHYVGCCPRCGKVFEKARGDQEYCGRACMLAVSQKKYHNKRKEK